MSARIPAVWLALSIAVFAAPAPQAPPAHEPGIYLATSDSPDAQKAAVKLKGQNVTDVKTHNMAAMAFTMGIAKPSTVGNIPGLNADLRRPAGELVFYFYFGPDAGRLQKPDPNGDPTQVLNQMGVMMSGDAMPPDATTADNFRLVEVFTGDHARVIDLPSPTSPTKIKNVVDTKVERLDQGVYRMRPKSALKPGEYALYYMSQMGTANRVWDFGVDVKTTTR